MCYCCAIALLGKLRQIKMSEGRTGVEFILWDVPRILTGGFPNVTTLNWGFPKHFKIHLQHWTVVRIVCTFWTLETLHCYAV